MCQPRSQEDKVIKAGKMSTEEYPSNPIAKNFIRLYRALPTVNVPFTKFDINFTLLTATFLYSVRLCATWILTNLLEWPEGSFALHESVGSFAAIVHSLLLVPGLFVALTSQPYRPTSHLNTAPQWWQDLVTAVLQFCTGYMIYDSLASYIVPKGFGGIEGSDWLFLGHHFATAVYMTQCRVLQAGECLRLLWAIVIALKVACSNFAHFPSHFLSCFKHARPFL